MEEARQIRLNKITAAIDDQKEKMAIQGMYVQALMAFTAGQEDPIFKKACAKAVEREDYHGKQVVKLEEERELLTGVVKAEEG